MKFTSQMTRRRAVGLATASLIISAGLITPTTSLGAAAGGTRAIPSGGTTSIQTRPFGVDGLQQPELRPGGRAEEEGAGEAGQFTRPRPGFKNGKFPKKPLDAPVVASSAVAGSNADVQASVNGLTHRDQRLANGGNQFSLEPPDQALCVGNGFVVEAVNSVLRVHSSANAAALSGSRTSTRSSATRPQSTARPA